MRKIKTYTKLLLWGLVFLSCKKTDMEKNNISPLEFVTTDGKKYVLKTYDKLLTGNLPNGFQIYPEITLSSISDLPGASTFPWQPTIINQQRRIIPLVFSQYMFVDNFAAPGGRTSIYRFTTPYLIEAGALPGKNTFAGKIAPYCNEVNRDTSFYNPAGTESIAYNGTVLLPYYEIIPFSSNDFKELKSPDGTIQALIFRPTTNAAAYIAQQQQTVPFPMRSPIPNDYNQLITVGYNPAFGANVTVSVHTTLTYFELER